MEDRFKFRIFCKSENKMMLFNNPTLIDGDILEGGLLFKNYDYKIKNVGKVKPEDLILMQCTGLKDKNGKLIYEGDIVSVLKLNCRFADGSVDRQNCINNNYDFGVVEYMNYNCQFMLAKRQYSNLLTNQWNNSIELTPSREDYEVEIIGNIYENPELLVN